MTYPAASTAFAPQAYWPVAYVPAAYPQPAYPPTVVPPMPVAPVSYAPVAVPTMAPDALVLSSQTTPAAQSLLNQLAAYADQLTRQPTPAPPVAAAPAVAAPAAPQLNPLGLEWVSAAAAPAPSASAPAASTSLNVDWADDSAAAPGASGPLQVDWVGGSTSAPAAPAAPAPPAAPKPEPKPPAPAPKPAAPTVTVQRGDSLSAIAGRTLGDTNRWREIYDLNRDQISNPNVIQAGMVLKLPGGANTSAPAPAPTARTGINTNRNEIFIRQPNNWTCGPTSLTMAAAAWGIRPANLATINELTAKTRTNPAYGIPDSNAIPDAARAIGLQAQFHGSSTPDSIRAALRRGHGVILNGSISGGVGHFIYVAGLNADGSFKICDPFRPGITAWNDAQLRQFTVGRGRMVEIWR